MRFLTPAMLTVILLLVVAGLVVAYVVKNLFATEPVAAPAPRNYPMAVADLEPGTVITAAHLAQGPYAGPPQKTFARADSILIGRVVREKIVAATPIDTTKLYPPGEFPPVEVAVGMRAVSLEVGSGAAIVDGLVRAGEYVDVHFTPSGYNDDRFRGGLTMTLFKGVKVLTVNRGRSAVGAARAGGINTVTLELSPEQSNILLLAKGKGELNLTYTPDGPGNGGVALADDDRAFLEEILGLAPPPEPKKPFVTEHYRGAGRGVMAFNDDGTLWGGDFGGDSYGYGGYGTGTRPAPRQVGGHEPTGGFGGGGYYRGIDVQSPPPGASSLPNAAPHGTPRLIPSPNSNNSNNGSGATEGRIPPGFDGV